MVTQNTSKAKEAQSTMVWTDDESELLLNVTLEYKVAKAAENVDWESVRSKYQDILDRMKAQLPANAEEASPTTRESYLGESRIVSVFVDDGIES